MQLRQKQIFFSPSDLITYMDSHFASHMERWRLNDPNVLDLMDEEDEMLKTLQQKGYDHEDAFLEHLKVLGKSVISIERASPEEMQRRTRAAMASGTDIIAQAYLERDNFGGLADFLVKVSGTSKLGNFHYEVWDTKLSRKIKPYFAIQLCCYAEMLECEQGIRPQHVAIVLGSNEIVSLRVQDYFAYYVSLKTSFLTFQDTWSANDKPDPADSVSFGRWANYAKEILLKRRHLSLVANIRRSQIKRLEEAGLKTIDELAKTSLDFIPKLNSDIFERLKAQAKIQIISEGQDKPSFEVLTHDSSRPRGLSLLPPASPNDIYFDIEGFPLVDGGLEYLWGATYFDKKGGRHFRDFWAHNANQEKKALMDFIDWVYGLWQADPSMHIYHYAAYEVSALTRLMGKYGTKEHEIDMLLRSNVFIDLYGVVRNGLLVGEPSYSIKNVEHLYRERRDTQVADGGQSVVAYEAWRNSTDGLTWKSSAVLNAIRDYNIDDCNSTQELAAWLRTQQSISNIAYAGAPLDEQKQIAEDETDVTRLRDKLLKLTETKEGERNQQVLRNLARLLEFHRRENKPTWWRLFERQGMTELDLYDDMDCLVGLKRTETPPFLPSPRARNKVYEFAFDIDQPFKGQAKSFFILGKDNQKVNAFNYDADNGLICIQSKDEPEAHLTLIPDEYVHPAPIPNAIQDVVTALLDSNFASSAIVDFLFRKKPRFLTKQRNPIIDSANSGDDLTTAVIGAVNDLSESYLCIQGPPGAGKTYTATRVISDLLLKGKRIGVSSNSHEAIINLMDSVAKFLIESGVKASLIKVGGDPENIIFEHDIVAFRKDAKSCSSELNEPSMCIGGTAWLFCNPLLTEAEGTTPLDFLFIDEAGQVSIANLVGMSRCAKNIILMGDQMQLGQPIQGSHPDESGQSILEYLLQGKATIPPDLGIFLPLTYRMHPDICQLVSEQVYGGQLKSADTTKKHVISPPRHVLKKNAGIYFLPVEHEGNTQGSEEEVEAIATLAECFIGLPLWSRKAITWADMLFMAPYNYQVNLLKTALPNEAKIGSVDKFQGQEAPIVFVSMCASDASESPRGLDFLFSKNRLNVSISRAQSLVIVAGSPRLATSPVNNLRQMELVNFYAEIVCYGA